LPPPKPFITRALSPSTPPHNPSTLLLLSIRVMLHEHPSLNPKEDALQEFFLSTLPELQLSSIEAADEALSSLIDAYLKRSPIPNVEAASPRDRLALFLDTLQELQHLPTEALRKKCFLLAAEMASLDPSPSPTKDLILEHIYTILGIAPDTARSILHTLSIKYSA
jgi:hypothetical protein